MQAFVIIIAFCVERENELSRLSYEQLDKLKEYYGVDRIWSHSRLNTYATQPWAYRIQYLEKLRPDTSNIYTYYGNIGHTLMEQLYEGEITKDDLSILFENEVLAWRMDDTRHKFMSENVERGYLDNLSEYFKDTEVLPYDVKVEKPVKAVFNNGEGKVVFVGYVDGLYEYEEDGEKVYVILDFKSSSKGQYSGKQLKANSKQLMLYAIAVHQETGVPYDRIKARFDMMKYLEVQYLQKNGKWRPALQERGSWVKSQENRIRTLLMDMGHDVFEIEETVMESISNNSLDNLPEEIQEKFKIGNAYIDVDVSEENAKELEEWIVATVNEVYKKEKGDWEVEFPEPVLDGSNDFYFKVLAKGLLKYHNGYQEEQAIKGTRGQSADLDELEKLFI